MEITDDGALSAVRGDWKQYLLRVSLCAAATNAAVEQAWVQQHSLADLQAPEIAYQVKAAPAKKRGAVIGSAAKLSSEGLMAAAKLAKEKEEQRRAQVRSCLGFSTHMHQITPAMQRRTHCCHV